MENKGIALDEVASHLSSAASSVYVAKNGELLGVILLADAVRPEARVAIEEMKNFGLDISLLTGDNEVTARSVGEQTGIQQVSWELLPVDKLAEVKRLQANNQVVAMIGDGINDAPSLAQADIGIAIASGTHIAIEAADITLVRSDLRDILNALRLSRATMRTIRQNLFFAFIYNLIGIPIAAGLLYPKYGIMLTPMFASAAMALSSVSVVMNSLRLRSSKI